MSHAAEALDTAARAGIHRLAIPTPFLVGRVNCYLIEDDPLTLLDTGPNSGKSLDELERALAEYGHRIEDLELIVVSHQHMDHLGLLEILARRSGAQVAAFHLLAPYLEDFSASMTADDAYADSVMRRHGVPGDLATVLGAVGAAFRAFGSSGRVTRPLRNGERLEFRNRELWALHRPGHSPSDTVFWDERRGILLASDHLLAHISSNAMVSRPLPGSKEDGGEPHPLLSYVRSMLATRELAASLVLTGHGEPISDHVALIDERLGMHARRARKLHRLLRQRPMTAYDLALKIWGNVAVTQAYLTISEVLGHLDLLAENGAVQRHDHGGVTRFEALSGASAPKLDALLQAPTPD